ncbi:MAG: hypothetical protein KBT31_00950 [Firmicutes bacterium]|nr:hypothetical protein [Candidatus Colimorpha enterica]
MKKIISAILAAIFVIAAVAACTKPETPSTDDTTAKTGDETTEAERVPRFYDNLDFEGTTVTVASRDAETTMYVLGEDGGDVVFASIYQANELVNGRLNIDRQYQLGSSDTNRFTVDITTQILANDCTADTVLVDQYYGTTYAPQGCYANICSSDYKGYLDLDRNWWYKDYMDNITIGNDTGFFLSGDASPSIFSWASCSFVNLNFYEDVIGDPQEFLNDVEAGKWNLDVLLELSKKVYLDLDEDEMVTGADRLGFAVVRGQSAMFAGICAGMKFINHNNDGSYTIVVDREQNYDIFSKLYRLYNEAPGIYTYTAGANEKYAKKTFCEGRSLFMNEYILTTWDEDVRSMENEFAVLPRPKFDENQENYITALQDSFMLYTLPTCMSLSKVPATTAMIEAQAIINNEIVIPSIFDTALKSKYRSDLVDFEQASRLIELVRSGITTDFGVVYNTNLDYIATMMGRLIENRKNAYASDVAGNIAIYQEKLNDLFLAFEQLK